MKNFTLLSFLSLFCFSSFAQSSQKPCSSPEASQFDFWIGTWDLYSADTLTGTNNIYKLMGDCAVQENFENKKTAYSGKSWSMYNAQAKLWQQTWIDNGGSFIYLSGNFENGAMVLKTEARTLASGKQQIYRMVYHNIKKDSFDWDWESTKDNGLTWQNGWHIHYMRKVP